MEREFQFTRDDIQRALVLMRTFAAIDAFTLEKDDLKVALNLSLLQRLRVLETRRRLTELTQCGERNAGSIAGQGAALGAGSAAPCRRVRRDERVAARRADL